MIYPTGQVKRRTQAELSYIYDRLIMLAREPELIECPGRDRLITACRNVLTAIDEIGRSITTDIAMTSKESRVWDGTPATEPGRNGKR